jgi:hypothetical protein
MTLKVRGGTPGMRHDRSFLYWLSQQKRKRRRAGGGGSPATNLELREDGSRELREDGSYEVRENG